MVCRLRAMSPRTAPGDRERLLVLEVFVGAAVPVVICRCLRFAAVIIAPGETDRDVRAERCENIDSPSAVSCLDDSACIGKKSRCGGDRRSRSHPDTKTVVERVNLARNAMRGIDAEFFVPLPIPSTTLAHLC